MTLTILAALYVAICAAQFGFTVWRDLRETRRRTEVDGLNRQFAKRAEEMEQRYTLALEGFREDLAKLRSSQ